MEIALHPIISTYNLCLSAILDDHEQSIRRIKAISRKNFDFTTLSNEGDVRNLIRIHHDQAERKR